MSRALLTRAAPRSVQTVLLAPPPPRPTTVAVGALTDKQKTLAITGGVGAGFALGGAAVPLLLGLKGGTALLAAVGTGLAGGLVLGFLVDAIAAAGSSG